MKKTLNNNVRPYTAMFISVAFCLISGVTSVCAKSSEAEKLNKAFNLMQEAMILLKEVQAKVEESALDPADYHMALEHIKTGRFEEAKKTLVRFSKGDDEKAVQSLYWIGLCFLEERNYERAIVAFSQFLTRLSDSEHSSTMLEMKKMANKHLVRCFEEIHRPISACSILKSMESEYPNEASYISRTYERLHCDRLI